MRAIIIGRNGQVAWELQQTIPQGVEVLVLGSKDIDILNYDELEEVILSFRPDVVINASAYTAVDKAESDIDNAYAINETAVKNLATIAKQLTCRFLHISTDFVFDGGKNTAYTIDDLPKPINVYGASKLAGERVIQAVYPTNSAIVRTSWVYSSHGSNFVKTMLRLMQEKDELSVVADQIGSPTYAKGLAKFLWQLATIKSVKPIYHWSDLGVASWYDFAVAIQEAALDLALLENKIKITPIRAEKYPTAATRPTFSVLYFDFEQSVHWREQLRECLLSVAK